MQHSNVLYSTKLWWISALNHIGGKNFGGLVDLHGIVMP